MLKTVTVNGKKADLNKAFPITIGDYKKLKERGLSREILSSAEFDLDDLSTFCWYFLNKANNDITVEDVDELDIHSNVLKEVMQGVNVGKAVPLTKVKQTT